MKNRNRKNELKIFLSDDEKYILEQKWKLSGTKSRSAFIRHPCRHFSILRDHFLQRPALVINCFKLGLRL